jgi:hypothetical protein
MLTACSQRQARSRMHTGMRTHAQAFRAHSLSPLHPTRRAAPQKWQLPPSPKRECRRSSSMALRPAAMIVALLVLAGEHVAHVVAASTLHRPRLISLPHSPSHPCCTGCAPFTTANLWEGTGELRAGLIKWGMPDWCIKGKTLCREGPHADPATSCLLCAATSFPPIAFMYDATSGFSYALFAPTTTPAVDAAQVWVAAEAACVGAGGHLTSISAVKEEAIVRKFVAYLTSPAIWAGYGNSTRCIWFGYSNVYDSAGNFTDGADPTYIRTKMTLGSTGFVNATYFSADAGCAAMCQDGAYYFRDCDTEPQAFVCKAQGSTPANSDNAASVTIPAAPYNGFTAVAATTGHSIPGAPSGTAYPGERSSPEV